MSAMSPERRHTHQSSRPAAEQEGCDGGRCQRHGSLSLAFSGSSSGGPGSGSAHQPGPVTRPSPSWTAGPHRSVSTPGSVSASLLTSSRTDHLLGKVKHQVRSDSVNSYVKIQFSVAAAARVYNNKWFTPFTLVYLPSCLPECSFITLLSKRNSSLKVFWGTQQKQRRQRGNSHEYCGVFWWLWFWAFRASET